MIFKIYATESLDAKRAGIACRPFTPSRCECGARRDEKFFCALWEFECASDAGSGDESAFGFTDVECITAVSSGGELGGMDGLLRVREKERAGLLKAEHFEPGVLPALKQQVFLDNKELRKVTDHLSDSQQANLLETVWSIMILNQVVP